MTRRTDALAWDAGRTLGMEAYHRIAADNPDKRVGEIVVAACYSAREESGILYDSFSMEMGLRHELSTITFGEPNLFNRDFG